MAATAAQTTAFKEFAKTLSFCLHFVSSWLYAEHARCGALSSFSVWVCYVLEIDRVNKFGRPSNSAIDAPLTWYFRVVPMAAARVLALQARLDDARDMLSAEVKKQEPRDNVLAAIKEQVRELHEELKMLTVPAGKSPVKSCQYRTCIFVQFA